MKEKEKNTWRREIFGLWRRRRIENEKRGKYLEKGRLLGTYGQVEWGLGLWHAIKFFDPKKGIFGPKTLF